MSTSAWVWLGVGSAVGAYGLEEKDNLAAFLGFGAAAAVVLLDLMLSRIQ